MQAGIHARVMWLTLRWQVPPVALAQPSDRHGCGVWAPWMRSCSPSLLFLPMPPSSPPSHGSPPPLFSLLPPSDHHGAGECGHPGRGNQGPHVRPQGRKPAQDEADLPCGAAHHAGRGAGKRMGAAGGVGNPFRARFQEIYRTVLRTMWDVVQVRVSRRDEPLLLPCDLRHAYSSHMFTCTSQGISSLH